MGDIVACEPIVRHLRRQYPESIIVFALHRRYRELADSHPEVDITLPIFCVAEWASFYKSGLFDVVVDLNIYERNCTICGFSWLKPDGSNGITSKNYYKHNLLTAFSLTAGIPAPADGPRVFLGKREAGKIDGLHLPPRFACIHAGSNETSREFLPSKWHEIVAYLNDRWGIAVVEIGLESRLPMVQDSLNRNFCGVLSILQSAEVIRRSVLYLGTDSGPAHLANAVGAYGVISFGHYRTFHKYMPYSGNYVAGIHCELLYHDGPVAEMPLEQIYAAIDRRMFSLLDHGGEN